MASLGAKYPSSRYLGVAKKDLRFLFTIATLLCSYKLFNSIRDPATKKWSSIALSFVLILTSTQFTLNQLVISLSYGLVLSSAIYFFKLSPKLPTVCFFGAFALVTLLRIWQIDFEHQTTAQTNLILMIMLLRSVSLSFDLQEFSADEKHKLTFDRVLGYIFCHCGLFIGPFYRYQVYTHWLHVNRMYDSDELENLDKQCRSIAIKKLPALLSMMASFFVGGLCYPITPNEIVINHKATLGELFLQTLATFYVARARLYIGFMLSEMCCVVCRLGVYPAELAPKPGHGPTVTPKVAVRLASRSEDDSKGKHIVYSAEAIQCYKSIYDVEWSGSVSVSMRCWNQTVQYWLAHYCYRKLKGNSDFLRILVTMFVSALWHGRHSGYFLSFAILPILMASEKGWQAYVKEAHLESKFLFGVFWCFKVSLIAYHAMAFFLLEFDLILDFYRTTLFYGFIGALVFAVYALILDII